MSTFCGVAVLFHFRIPFARFHIRILYNELSGWERVTEHAARSGLRTSFLQ